MDTDNIKVFTDRFIQIPIEIVSKKQKELIGEEFADKEIVRAMINPFCIESYREDPGTDEDPTRRTVIYFKSSESMVAEMDIESFEKLLNQFG